MKALILAGGRGTRLRPITHTSAKQLVPVANKPVLFYGLEAIRDAGITDVGIVVSDPREMLQPDHRTGEQITVMVNSQAEIRAAVGDGSRFGAAGHLHRAGGAARARARGQDLRGRSWRGDPFVMYLGDNLIKDGITPFVQRVRGASSPTRRSCSRTCTTPQDFGVAELEGDRVVRLEEKPKQPTQRPGAGRRLHVRRSRSSRRCDAIQPSDARRARDHRRDPVPDRPAARRVRSHVITGWWKDTGKVEDMLEAQPHGAGATRDRRSRARSTRRRASRARCVVGPGHGGRALAAARAARDRRRTRAIVDAYIGPFTSIADGVEHRAQRDRALDRARAQPRSTTCRAHRVEPDRQGRGGARERRAPARAPADARRLEPRGAGVKVARSPGARRACSAPARCVPGARARRATRCWR